MHLRNDKTAHYNYIKNYNFYLFRYLLIDKTTKKQNLNRVVEGQMLRIIRLEV